MSRSKSATRYDFFNGAILLERGVGRERVLSDWEVGHCRRCGGIHGHALRNSGLMVGEGGHGTKKGVAG